MQLIPLDVQCVYLVEYVDNYNYTSFGTNFVHDFVHGIFKIQNKERHNA